MHKIRRLCQYLEGTKLRDSVHRCVLQAARGKQPRWGTSSNFLQRFIENLQHFFHNIQDQVQQFCRSVINSTLNTESHAGVHYRCCSSHVVPMSATAPAQDCQFRGQLHSKSIQAQAVDCAQDGRLLICTCRSGPEWFTGTLHQFQHAMTSVLFWLQHQVRLVGSKLSSLKPKSL